MTDRVYPYRTARYAASYLAEFFDVMREALTLCLEEEEFFREKRKEYSDDCPGQFIEDPEVEQAVERLGRETGQVAVWVRYALFSMMAE